MIQKALGLDKGRTNEAKMNSVLDTSARDPLALTKKNSAPEENAKGKAKPPHGD
jgi:hypothetical protein